MAGFDLLDPVLQHHIVNSLGWPGLRPLQDESVASVNAGADALLLAPTAGGKTEAAMFPLLTRMQAERWTGISVLYICPLKALLNNLQPRLAEYAAWLGRSAMTWHGDVGQSVRGRIKRDRPDILLTTPESLESMLVSESVDAAALLGGVRAVVVDEVHAFAGDDRGWHLLAVLARLETLLGRRLQRVGMSATVGNPDELLGWLQGGAAAPGRVISPAVPGGAVVPEITVDSVGGVENAAKVIAALHAGEKRLVFVDSRRLAEELGTELRRRGITTFISHSSLSAAERRESEQAFAEARDCVIVATSTLELGIDVGDLDRVIQINAPRTVSSFLQRLGRTGRRPGTARNCLFLGLTDQAALDTLGLLQCWSTGWVEPVLPTPQPRHIAAQQLLAAALQTRRVPLSGWRETWGSLPLFDADGQVIFDHLLAEGFLEHDAGSAFIGPEAEKHFGRRHFMELLAVFTAAPEFTVWAGRQEIGSVETSVLTDDVEGPRILLLGGRSWKVTHIDWKRRHVFVEASDIAGRAKWSSVPDGASFEIARGIREVLLGAIPAGVTLTRRAAATLDDQRLLRADQVTDGAFVIARDDRDDWRWWTWAGAKANRTLAAWAPDLVPPRQRIGAESLRLHADLTVADIRSGLAALRAAGSGPLPAVDTGALRGLKFSAALPEQLARQTLAARTVDRLGAVTALADTVLVRGSS
ncbi:DEAD/DEAH box helicase [Rhodococcus aetherivorans]|uniref:DEAD/DEAH box helicase n=1 Tax=Rhodococcus aetherivorans TaxID=191292 RepID=UPI002948D065|nr:DEAD/DEAH box helicase [Rhodococcus aetherivorans]MDV6292343.1 DEAD/DEAH box helicase [Rhodococcus aetherivorans]